MTDSGYEIFPLGAGALTVEFRGGISISANDLVAALDRAVASLPFPGFIESVPAYCSLTVFFDVNVVRSAFPRHKTAFDAVAELMRRFADRLDPQVAETSRLVELHVDFSTDCGPDLHEIAAAANIDRDEFVDLFTSTEYRVFMLGFLPGFAYMGTVDERIAAPRLATPRTSVPAGSVGIAGRQTGIYPIESPGGWRIVGRTSQKMFDPHAERPCFLRAGDRVRFVPVKE